MENLIQEKEKKQMAYACPIYPSKFCCQEAKFFPKKECRIRYMWAWNINLLQLLQNGKERGKGNLLSLRIGVFIIFLIVMTKYLIKTKLKLRRVYFGSRFGDIVDLGGEGLVAEAWGGDSHFIHDEEAETNASSPVFAFIPFY